MNYDMHHKHEYFKFLACIGCAYPIHFFFQISDSRGKKLLDKYLKNVPSCPIPLNNVVLGF